MGHRIRYDTPVNDQCAGKVHWSSTLQSRLDVKLGGDKLRMQPLPQNQAHGWRWHDAERQPPGCHRCDTTNSRNVLPPAFLSARPHLCSQKHLPRYIPHPTFGPRARPRNVTHPDVEDLRRGTRTRRSDDTTAWWLRRIFHCGRGVPAEIFIPLGSHLRTSDANAARKFRISVDPTASTHRKCDLSIGPLHTLSSHSPFDYSRRRSRSMVGLRPGHGSGTAGPLREP
jgi:hypothetical protein